MSLHAAAAGGGEVEDAALPLPQVKQQFCRLSRLWHLFAAFLPSQYAFVPRSLTHTPGGVAGDGDGGGGGFGDGGGGERIMGGGGLGDGGGGCVEGLAEQEAQQFLDIHEA